MRHRIFITTLISLGLLAACSPAETDPTETPAASEVSDPPETPPETSAETAANAPQTELETPASGNIETVGYPEGWELQPFWSGEYPNAFSVTQEGVTVMGHEKITYGVYPPIYCGLPYKATYSPWNGERIAADNLTFVAMTYPTKFTMKEDASVMVIIGDGDTQLELKAGDDLIYKSYLAEGFFIAEKDGVQYEMNEQDLPQSTQFEQGPEDQEWVQVTCDDATRSRAWVLYDDAIGVPGVEVFEYTGYAVAEDLP